MYSAKASIFTLILLATSDAFSVSRLPSQKVVSSSTSLNMVFGPKQALAIEKRKNPQAVESTIQGLMKTKSLTRAQAEEVSQFS